MMTSYQNQTAEEREAAAERYRLELEQRRAKEQTEADRTLELFQTIAAELSAGRDQWSADWLRDCDGTPYNHGLRLVGPDCELFARRITYGAGAGRLEVSASPPQGIQHPRGPRPEVTVSSSRSAAAIAKDLTRRLIPAARTYYAAALEQDNAVKTAAAGQAATLARLEELGARGYRHEPARFSAHDLPGTSYATGRISHDGSSVELELHGMTPDTAAAVLELISKASR